MNRRVLAVLLAVLLAVVGASLVIVYARNADRRAIADAQPTNVYVAEKLVPAGTTLKDAQRLGLIGETQVAKKGLPKGALSSIDADNSSLLALSDVQPGEYLLAARFGSTPVGTKAIEVPPGKLAMSVELTDPARVGKFVTPGSHITIYYSYKLKSLATSDQAKALNQLDLLGTRVLLEDVQVIGMGDSPLNAPTPSVSDSTDKSTQQQKSAPSFLVTVAVDPTQALRLVQGVNAWTLYAGLRGADVKIDPNAETDALNIARETRLP